MRACVCVFVHVPFLLFKIQVAKKKKKYNPLLFHNLLPPNLGHATS